MARALRTDLAGALHHVTSRGNERRPFFYDDNDREVFLEYLGLTVRRFGWSVSAFVLMTNHFHLVVQTAEANLSRGSTASTSAPGIFTADDSRRF
jgi:REP element-mobilizing transposase RayT